MSFNSKVVVQKRRQTDKHTQRERERETDRQTDRHTHTANQLLYMVLKCMVDKNWKLTKNLN